MISGLAARGRGLIRDRIISSATAPTAEG